MNKIYLYCRSSENNPGFAKFIQSLGGDAARLLEDVYGPKQGKQNKLNLVPGHTLYELYEGSAKAFNEPYFGIKWALAMPKDFRNTGPNVFFLSISKNIEHFLKMAINFQKLHTNVISFSYTIDETEKELIGLMRFHPMAQYSRQLVEHHFAVNAQFGSKFLPGYQIKRIEFQHSEAEDMTIYNEAFKCPVYFNCDENRLIVDQKWIKLGRKGVSHQILTPLVKKFVNWRIHRNLSHKATIAMTLAELLPSLLGVRKSDIITVSSAMNINPKKLQRLLKDEGTSYSQILDDVRRNLASHLLIDTDIPMTRIALLLDYASDKSFIAAFKRWFNDTPAKYRRLNKTS